MRIRIIQDFYVMILFIMVLCLSSCTHKKDLAKEKLYIEKNKQPIIVHESDHPEITIWIHGTIIFHKALHRTLFNNRYGLHPVAHLSPEHQYYRLASSIAENDPEHFPLEGFYVFVWSGKLSAKERKIAAENLYYELSDLIVEYQKKYKCDPIIRIIAHSHGGNVVLHMAKLDYASFISIEDLILLACPVQEKTMHLIYTPIFKRIYSLYSSIDLIQIIAPQIRCPQLLKHSKRHRYKVPSFSSRLFPPAPHLMQTKIKLNNYPILHTHFSRTDFVAMIPTIVQKLQSWDSCITQQEKQFKHKLLCIYR